MATVLILVSSIGLNVWVANVGRYDQVYGQVGAIMVLMVLVGAEVNAVLARTAEERKDTDIVRPQGSGDQGDTQLNNTSERL